LGDNRLNAKADRRRRSRALPTNAALRACPWMEHSLSWRWVLLAKIQLHDRLGPPSPRCRGRRRPARPALAGWAFLSSTRPGTGEGWGLSWSLVLGGRYTYTPANSERSRDGTSRQPPVVSVMRMRRPILVAALAGPRLGQALAPECKSARFPPSPPGLTLLKLALFFLRDARSSRPASSSPTKATRSPTPSPSSAAGRCSPSPTGTAERRNCAHSFKNTSWDGNHHGRRCSPPY